MSDLYGSAAYVRDELARAQDRIAKLKREQGVAKTRVGNAISFLSQFSEAERDQALVALALRELRDLEAVWIET